MPRRKKLNEEVARLDPEELEHLRGLIAKEEELEAEMKQDLAEAISARDKKLLRELRRLNNKNRRLLMWVGVVALMLIIVGFWLSRLETVVTAPMSESETNQVDLNSARENLQTTVQQVIKSIEDIKRQAKELDAESATATPPVRSEKLP